MDLGVLTLKPGALPIDPVSKLPNAEPSHSAVVEWRALTVILLCVNTPTCSNGQDRKAR